MIQREREAEGDEFRDKEAFVTQAYKDQMAEVRRAEEEERAREGVYLLLTHGHSS
jgi:coiled-coil domain-containing protein 55